MLANDKQNDSKSLPIVQSTELIVLSADKEKEPPLPPKGFTVDDDFEQFWMQYPRKTGKKAALKAWNRAEDRPAIDLILLSVDQAKRSEQWRKDNGQFIPLPATWINQGRWDDRPFVLSEQPRQKPKLAL